MLSNYHKYQDYYQNYNKKYYEEHKDKIKERNRNSFKEEYRRIVICECGKEIKHYSIPKHKLSKRHLEYLNNK